MTPLESGLPFKLNFNQHAVSSDSPCSFAGLLPLCIFLPLMCFVLLLQSQAQQGLLGHSHTGTMTVNAAANLQSHRVCFFKV